MVRICFIVEGETEEKYFTSELFINLLKYKDNSIDWSSKEEIYISPFNIGGHGSQSFGNIYNQTKSLLNNFDICVYALDIYHNNWGMKLFNKKPNEIFDSIYETHFKKIKTNENHYVLPWISIQEFETLLFSQPNVLVSQINSLGLRVAERELINTQEESDIEYYLENPSKRIEDILVDYHYSKPSFFRETMEKINLEVLLKKCPHFNKTVDCFVKNVKNVMTGKKSYKNVWNVLQEDY